MSRASSLAVVVVLFVLCFAVSAPVLAQPTVPMLLPARLEPSTATLLDATTADRPTRFATVGVLRLTLKPSLHPLIVPPRSGPLFVVVEVGKLTVTQNGDETPLAAGEMFAPADQDQEITLRVSGLEAAIVFVVSLKAPHATPCYWVRDPLVHTLDVLINTAGDVLPLPGGSVHLVLERLTLPSGSGLPPQQASPLSWTEVGSGVLGLTLTGQMPFRWEPGQERTFQHGARLPIIPAPLLNPLMAGGTWMLLRNAGKSPLVLYRLTLAPGAGSPSAGLVQGGTPLS